MYMNGFVWVLSHDPVNEVLAPGLGADRGFDVQTRFLTEGLPDRDCRGLVVDLDSVAPGRLALQRLVKELSERSDPYPVVVFGYSLEDDQILDLRAAGTHVFQHGLCPAVFAAIARSFPTNSNRFVWLLSHDEVNQHLASDLASPHDLIVQLRWLKEGLPGGDCRGLVVDFDAWPPGAWPFDASSRN
jgi:hypothetical protein